VGSAGYTASNGARSYYLAVGAWHRHVSADEGIGRNNGI